jgi:hypothetical protein
MFDNESSERNRRWAERFGFVLVLPIETIHWKGAPHVKYALDLEERCHQQQQLQQ